MQLFCSQHGVEMNVQVKLGVVDETVRISLLDK